MAKRRLGLRSLLIAASLVLAAGASRAVQAQDISNLQRVGIELARFNKPGALYGYLRDYHPTYFAVADKAGLAEALDGKLDGATFQQRFEAGLASAGLSPADQKTATAEGATMKGVLSTLASQTGPKAGLTAAQVKGNADLVPELRRNLYEADKHWISELWSKERRGSVGVKFVPGTVAWFNPAVSIPELGIRAGVPLTPAQKEAVAKLFSFETVPNAPTTAEGTAAFPEHVGRAINPNSHVLTVLNDRGEVISDLVVKGGGPNKPNATRDGRLETSEALMDSEVARNLYRSGVKNYDALCVIVPDGMPDKALLVRAPRSMMRHIDMDKLNDEELKKTLERHAREASIRDGLSRPLSVAEWVRGYLPRVSGENWGLLSGLGVEHGSVYTRDNHGLGETVDWGWVALHEGGKTDQKSYEWENVKETIERVNKILLDAEKVIIDQAKKIFDAAFDRGKARGLEEKVRLDPTVLEKLSDSDLRTLASDRANPAKPNATPIEKLRDAGNVVEKVPFTTLARLPLSALRGVAEHNGIVIAKNADRATVIAALEGRPVAEINAELTKAKVGGVDRGTPDTDGMSDRLREMIRNRTKGERDKIGR